MREMKEGRNKKKRGRKEGRKEKKNTDRERTSEKREGEEFIRGREVSKKREKKGSWG